MDLFRAMIPESKEDTNMYDLPHHIIQYPSSIVIRIEMPGFDKKSVDVDVYSDSGKITVRGTKTEPPIDNTSTTSVSNCIKYGHFFKTISIPEGIVNKEYVALNYTNGILCITISKPEEKNTFHLGLQSSREEKEKEKEDLD